MPATVRRETTSGFKAIVLENRRIRAVVIPQLGGRVWELHDRARRRQWIWHREEIPLTAAPPGSNYDEVWAGGWEELFPNDAPGRYKGRDLPDHGEWWTTSWTVAEASGGTTAVLRLSADSFVRRAACTKEFRLGEDADHLQVSYRIENREAEGFHFLFKQHLAIAISPSCRLALPGGVVTAVEPGFGTILPGAGPYEWPTAGGVDLQQVPDPATAGREFVYMTNLLDSWCGVDDLATGSSLRMRFDGQRLPFLWLFLSYGGWRGCYTAVLEPCTNMPKDLAQAVRAGQSAHLAAGEAFETSVSVTLSEAMATT